MATFTWIPQTASKTVEPRVRRAAFGDGYEQRVASGINTRPATWSLTFSRIAADINAIEAFLIARNGTESFDWTDPDGTAIKATCAGWTRTPNAGMASGMISATFKQVYGE